MSSQITSAYYLGSTEPEIATDLLLEEVSACKTNWTSLSFLPGNAFLRKPPCAAGRTVVTACQTNNMLFWDENRWT